MQLISFSAFELLVVKLGHPVVYDLPLHVKIYFNALNLNRALRIRHDKGYYAAAKKVFVKEKELIQKDTFTKSLSNAHL